LSRRSILRDSRGRSSKVMLHSMRSLDLTRRDTFIDPEGILILPPPPPSPSPPPLVILVRGNSSLGSLSTTRLHFVQAGPMVTRARGIDHEIHTLDCFNESMNNARMFAPLNASLMPRLQFTSWRALSLILIASNDKPIRSSRTASFEHYRCHRSLYSCYRHFSCPRFDGKIDFPSNCARRHPSGPPDSSRHNNPLSSPRL